MKTIKELHEILNSVPFGRINAHVHTHVCDGAPDMTAAAIAREAEAAGIGLVILTPHFHRRVQDGRTALYADSDPAIFPALREEIDHYERSGGSVKLLLSAEADILDTDGTISFQGSPEAERAMDLVSPTLNYHPLLALEGVAVTHIREMDDYHESGRFAAIAAEAFPDADDRHAAVIESGFDAQINALRRCLWPAMLGHFLIAHTKPARTCTWFGESERHLALMKAKTAELLAVCRRTGGMMDLTGLHLYHCTTMADQRLHDGFLYDYQRGLLGDCRAMGIPCAPGSDAHGLGGIRDSRLFDGYWE